MGGGSGVDLHAHLVDGDVMVVPAEADQVFGIMIPAVGPLFDVVGLDPVAAVAPFDRTLSLVPPEYVAADYRGGWLLPCRCRRRDGAGR